jgi:hypothetical protein
MFTIIALLISPLLRAQIGPVSWSENLVPAFEKADLVCNCHVQSLTERDETLTLDGAPATRRFVSATVHVDDAYKATPSVGSEITVEYQEITRTGLAVLGFGPRLQKEETALLFLTFNGQSFSFADSLGATKFSRLPRVTSQVGIEKLQSALSAVVSGSNREDRIKALRLMGGFDKLDPRTLSTVEPYSTSDDPEVAFGALSVLLRTRTLDSVERLRRYLLAYDSDSQPLALINAGTLLGGIDDPRARPALEELSESRFVAVRLGAMDALRSVKSRDSAPTLVRHLDDPDGTIQYLALITLAEIFGKTDGDYAPTMNLFDKKPGYYTSLWKKWCGEPSNPCSNVND